MKNLWETWLIGRLSFSNKCVLKYHIVHCFIMFYLWDFIVFLTCHVDVATNQLNAGRRGEKVWKECSQIRSQQQLRGRNGSGSESDCSFRSLAEKSERALALWQRAVSDHDSQHDMTFGHLPFGPEGFCRCKLFSVCLIIVGAFKNDILLLVLRMLRKNPLRRLAMKIVCNLAGMY